MSTAVRHDRSRRINRELVTTYVIVAVLMAYFALRHFYPTLFAFFVSFNKYDLLTGAFSFVGIDNYNCGSGSTTATWACSTGRCRWWESARSAGWSTPATHSLPSSS